MKRGGKQPKLIDLQFGCLVMPLVTYTKRVCDDINQKLTQLGGQIIDVDLERFFVQYNSFPSDLLQKIRNCVQVIHKNSLEGFHVMRQHLPNLTVTDRGQPSFTVQTYNDLYRQKNFEIDWNQPVIRTVYSALMDLTMGVFLDEITKCMDRSKLEDLTYFFNDVIQIIFPQTPRTDTCQRLFLVGAEHWASALYQFSLSLPSVVFQTLISNIPNKKSKDIAYVTLFKVYQFIHITNDTRFDLNEFSNQLKFLVSKMVSFKTEPSWYEAGCLFTENIMGYMLAVFPELRKSALPYDIYKILKKTTKDRAMSGPSIQLMTTIYIFSEHPKMNLLQEFIPKHILGDNNISSSLLSMTQLLKGKNWRSKQFVEDPGYPFSCFITDETLRRQVYEQVEQFILSKDAFDDDVQILLGDCLSQLASTDIKKFVNSTLGNFINSIRTQPNNKIALTILTRNVLSPTYDFKQKCHGITSDLIDEFLSQVYGYASEQLENQVTQPLTDCYQSKAFNEKLRENRGNLWKTIDGISTDLEFTTGSESPPKLIPNDLSKAWACVSPLSKDLFASITKEKVSISNNQSNSKIAQLASIIPYLQPNQDTIDPLFRLLLSNDGYLGQVSLHVLCACLYLDSSLFNYIVFNLSKLNLYNPASLHQIISNLLVVLNTGVSIKATLEKQTTESLLPLILMGWCSSVISTRRLAIKLGSLVSSFNKNNKIDAFSVYSDSQTKIAESIKYDVLQIDVFDREDRLFAINSIPAGVIIESISDDLFLFFLKHFGKVIARSIPNEMVTACRDYFKTNIAWIAKCSPLSGINSLVLMATLGANPQGAFEMFTSCIKALHGVSLLLPLTAFFTSFNRLDSLELLLDLNQQELPMLHAIATSVRMLSDKPDGIPKYIALFLNIFEEMQLTSTKVDFKANKELLAAGTDLSYTLMNYATVVEQYFNTVYATKIVYKPSIFPLSSKYDGFINPIIKSTHLFTFLLNITCSGIKNLEPVKHALSSFVRCYIIPDKMYLRIGKNFTKILKYSPETYAHVLQSAYDIYLNLFLTHAKTHEKAFRALACYFQDPFDSTLIGNWKEQIENAEFQSVKDENECTFSHIGIVLLLSLYYLTSNDVLIREDAFRVLFAVVLPSIFMKNKNADIHPVCNLLWLLRDEVLKQKPALFESTLIKLSMELRKIFGFCAEQFISCAFDIFKEHRDNILFLRIVIPWATNFVLSYQDIHLIKETSDQFLTFTTYSYIRRLVDDVLEPKLTSEHMQLIDILLKAEVDDDRINPIELVVTILYSIYVKSPESEGVILSILEFIVSKCTQFMMNYISTLFTYKTWLYYNMIIQESFDRFIQNKGQEEEDEEETVPSPYEGYLKITTKLIERLYLSHVDYFVDLCPVISINYFLLSDIYKDGERGKMLTLIFRMIPETAKTNKGDIIRNMFPNMKLDLNLVTQMAIYISSLNAAQKSRVLSELLQWGLSCGEMKIACNALRMYLCVVEQIDQDLSLLVIRNLWSLAATYHEATDKTQNISITGAISTLISEKLDEQDIIQLISLNLDLLDRIQQRYPTLLGFQVAREFIKCHEKERLAIFSSALDVMITILRQCAFTFDDIGLIIDIIKCQHTPETVTKVHTLLGFLITKRICNTNQASNVLFIAYLPFYRQSKDVMESIASVCSQQQFIQSFGSESTKDIVDSIDDEMFKCDELVTLIEFLTQLVFNDLEYAEIVFTIAQKLIESVEPSVFGGLAWKATSLMHIEPAINFLVLFTAKNDDITVSAPHSIPLRAFPLLQFPKEYDPCKWEPPETALEFTSLEDLPPTLVFDAGFNGRVTTETIFQNMQRMKISPLARWDEMTFKAESLNDAIYVESVLLPKFDCSRFSAFIECLEECQKTYTMAADEAAPSEQAQKDEPEVNQTIEPLTGISLINLPDFYPDDPANSCTGLEELDGIALF